MKKLLFVLSVFFILTLGCTQSNEPDNPDWVNNLIEQFKSQPVGNPPQSIWRYSYKDQTVYYVPAQCCDQFSNLFDESGKVICKPDGGFAGGGDGKCPDFFKERKDEKLIWSDSRTR
ncbi:MAG: hypothetical protein NTX65_15350 [Ignavibacteriales bacterium]|nr:hypothetical protein [Ignavibacteriales bacterium]